MNTINKLTVGITTILVITAICVANPIPAHRIADAAKKIAVPKGLSKLDLKNIMLWIENPAGNNQPATLYLYYNDKDFTSISKKNEKSPHMIITSTESDEGVVTSIIDENGDGYPEKKVVHNKGKIQVFEIKVKHEKIK